VTSGELLPVIRKALPSESEFSETVANNIAFAVSDYLLNRNVLPEPGQLRSGHGQRQRVAAATDMATDHDADGQDDADDDAFAAAYRAAKVNAPVAVAKLTSVHYWADPGGRGRIRTEDGYESTWSGGHYEGAAKLAAEHGLRVKRVDNDSATTWTRS
jgi:hypothetical protein